MVILYAAVCQCDAVAGPGYVYAYSKDGIIIVVKQRFAVNVNNAILDEIRFETGLFLSGAVIIFIFISIGVINVSAHKQSAVLGTSQRNAVALYVQLHKPQIIGIALLACLFYQFFECEFCFFLLWFFRRNGEHAAKAAECHCSGCRSCRQPFVFHRLTSLIFLGKTSRWYYNTTLIICQYVLDI